ncbi:MAG: hypothetical protein GX049_06865 [Alcaligenaceae bacterium]|nr:hypothetical protein [Alcaligenaceae bacterium]
MKFKFAAFCLFWALGVAHANPNFSGPNFSGEYSCEGDDSHDGKYTAKITLQLIPEHSIDDNGAYSFKLESAGYGVYTGFAAAQGTTAAIYFANTDPSTKDYGTGVATFNKNSQDKWAFKKYYYEPEYKGGNYGFETCTQN